jgi:hypothetical protein
MPSSAYAYETRIIKYLIFRVIYVITAFLNIYYFIVHENTVTYYAIKHHITHTHTSFRKGSSARSITADHTSLTLAKGKGLLF